MSYRFAFAAGCLLCAQLLTTTSFAADNNTIDNQSTLASADADATQTSTATGAPSAETTTVAGPTELAEVNVTARRVSENIQTVPIAITDITPQRLQELGVQSLVDIQDNLPGVTLCCTPWNSAISSIRGISSGMPTYFADVPVANEGYANFFDISDFELLKGPQGTLFGQSAVAGAFVFQPNMPSDTFGGYLTASGGSYGKRLIQAAVNIPLADDHVLIRLAAETDSRNGYIHDLSNGVSYGNEDFWVARPSMIIKITDNLQNYTMFQYHYGQDNGYGSGMWVLEDINFNPSQPSLYGFASFVNGGSPAAFTALATQALLLRGELGPYTVPGTGAGCASPLGPTFTPQQITTLKASGTACPGEWYRDQLLINTTTWKVGENWTLKNIFHWDNSSSFAQQQWGGLYPLDLLTFGSPRQDYPTENPSIWSDEIQVVGKAGRFDITAGSFNTAQSVHQPTANQFLTAELPTTDTQMGSYVHSIYGQTDVHLDDLVHGLTATLGGRFEQDGIEETAVEYNPDTLAYLGQVASSDTPGGHAVFHALDYTFGLRYQYTPGTMFYLTDTRGYSAGGFQSTPGIGAYAPEYLTMLEPGVKSTFQLGSVTTRVNASYYYGWFDNAQVPVSGIVDVPLSGPSFIIETENAATARVKGVDAEVDVLPVTGLELGGFLATNGNYYTHYIGQNNSFSGQLFNYSGTPFAADPKVKFGFHGRYTLPLAPEIGRVSFNATYTHQSYQVETVAPPTPTNPANPTTGLICTRQRTLANGYPAALADGATEWVDCSPPIGNLDIGASWQDPMGHQNMTVSFTMTNVTRNQYSNSVAQLDALTAFTALQPAVPRMWYLTVSYKFQ